MPMRLDSCLGAMLRFHLYATLQHLMKRYQGMTA